MAVLKASKVVKEFPPPTKNQPTVRALDGLDFEISGKTFVTMVGPSGCGKSTFLNIVSGVETPTSGSGEGHRRQRCAGNPGLRLPGPEVASLADRRRQLGATSIKINPRELEQIKLYLDMVGLQGFEQMYPAPSVLRQSRTMQRQPRPVPSPGPAHLCFMDSKSFSHLDAIMSPCPAWRIAGDLADTRKTVLFVTQLTRGPWQAVQLSASKCHHRGLRPWNYAHIQISLALPPGVFGPTGTWPGSRVEDSRRVLSHMESLHSESSSTPGSLLPTASSSRSTVVASHSLGLRIASSLRPAGQGRSSTH